MEREEPNFILRVKPIGHDSSVIPRANSQTLFQLKIHTVLTDGNGNDVEADDFQYRSLLQDFEFGRRRHHRRVANLLRQVGWRNEDSLQFFLYAAFSDAKQELERLRGDQKISSRNRGIPTITFHVDKFVRWEVELPKPVPATKESIQALNKWLLEADTDEDCIICMEQLCSGTEVTQMPCLHLFHGDCIQKWLNTSHICPLCRHSMPIDG
ncbi:Zinc finger, RING-type [Corchorus capsularis]|uniref:RING-type E3 ubiquitin transferase n=1 Tax=Corchorus capsularis TaxID=210143 RepID=A0A1R3GTP5_COCAP|nr:Zinc finger, RING-type [Corchorus capsularis]